MYGSKVQKPQAKSFGLKSVCENQDFTNSVPEGRLNFKGVLISGSACFLTMQLVDCFEESLKNKIGLVLLIVQVRREKTGLAL
jgi:hypothetical protein